MELNYSNFWNGSIFFIWKNGIFWFNGKEII